MKNKVLIVNVVVIGLLLCGQYWIKQQNQKDTLRSDSIGCSINDQIKAAANRIEELKKHIEDTGANDIKFKNENGLYEDIFYALNTKIGDAAETYIYQGENTVDPNAVITTEIQNDGTKRIKIRSVNDEADLRSIYIKPQAEFAEEVYGKLAKIEELNDAKRLYKKKLAESYRPGKYRITSELGLQYIMYVPPPGAYNAQYEVGDVVEITKSKLDKNKNGLYDIKGLLKSEDDSKDKWIVLMTFAFFVKEKIKVERVTEEESTLSLTMECNSLHEDIRTKQNGQIFIWVLIVLLVCITVFIGVFQDDEEDAFEYVSDQPYIADGAYYL